MNVETMFGDDRGVSPVIGVILMVAITVILAAVIGTFVLGLGDSIGQSTTAGISVDQNATDVTVTLASAGTAERVEIRQGGSPQGNLSSVGETVVVPVSGGDIQVIGFGSDGSETLIRTIEP